MKGGADKRRAVFGGRRFGPTQAHRERLDAFNAEQLWTGTCSKCRAVLKGRLDVIRAHKCEGGDGTATADTAAS